MLRRTNNRRRCVCVPCQCVPMPCLLQKSPARAKNLVVCVCVLVHVCVHTKNASRNNFLGIWLIAFVFGCLCWRLLLCSTLFILFLFWLQLLAHCWLPASAVVLVLSISYGCRLFCRPSRNSFCRKSLLCFVMFCCFAVLSVASACKVN